MLKAIRRITSAFVTIAIFSMLIIAFSNVVKNKYADRKYADFFEQDADFDVLFMGTSHTLNAILPMELWNSVL